MYYKNIVDLPEKIKKKLSAELQKFYMNSFNECWEEFIKLESRNHDNLNSYEKAHRGALASINAKVKGKK